ncbi:MAG TPA: S1/P1 nuclease [Sphingomonas sp.]|nr:S1/P1 nuclease [Sphingomonas sp.]
MAALLAALPCTPAAAWSAQGHMASGALAYDVLVEKHPTAVDAIRALIAHHPDRARFDAALRDLTGAVRDRTLFVLMARWPDDIRHSAYDHPGWHHELRVVSGWTLFAPLRFGSMERAFNRNLRIARDTRSSPARRAVALCWVFHIVGDVHQPLHAGHRMDAHFPVSDKAGSIGWVRAGPGVEPRNFHLFWDGAADRPGSEADGAAEIAREAFSAVTRQPPPTGEGPPKRQFHGWVRESERLAAEIAYQGDGLRAARHPVDAPPLSPDYVERARNVAERRIGEAGMRLAELLAALIAVD